MLLKLKFFIVITLYVKTYKCHASQDHSATYRHINSTVYIVMHQL